MQTSGCIPLNVSCEMLLAMIDLLNHPFLINFVVMKYTVSTKQATLDADEFIRRYRDIGRIREYCLQCPGYGKSWSCPPFDFDPATMTDGFKNVTLLGTVIEFDEQTRAECKTPEQALRVGKQAMEEVFQTLLPQMYEMERELPGSRCFTFRCVLCPEGCTRPDGKPWRHPQRLRYSLESVGFDITTAATDLLGITLDWSADGSLSKTITLLTALFS